MLLWFRCLVLLSHSLINDFHDLAANVQPAQLLVDLIVDYDTGLAVPLVYRSRYSTVFKYSSVLVLQWITKTILITAEETAALNFFVCLNTNS